MIGCLRTRVRKQPIIALYFESENELKLYNFEARRSLWGFCVLCLFCYAVLYGLSCFAIILIKLRELAALQLLSPLFLVTFSVLWLFLAIPCVGLQCVIVVFHGDTRLPLSIKSVVRYDILTQNIGVPGPDV